MIVPDPVTYFQGASLVESLVLSVAWNADARTLHVVINAVDVADVLKRKAMEVAGRATDSPPRDFRKFLFTGVSRLERQRTFLRHGSLGFDAFDLNIPPKNRTAPSIENVEVTRSRRLYKCRLHLGTVGVYLFLFEAFEVELRLGRGVPVGDAEWLYFDVETGQQFDFYAPFESET